MPVHRQMQPNVAKMEILCEKTAVNRFGMSQKISNFAGNIERKGYHICRHLLQIG